MSRDSGARPGDGREDGSRDGGRPTGPVPMPADEPAKTGYAVDDTDYDPEPSSTPKPADR